MASTSDQLFPAKQAVEQRASTQDFGREPDMDYVAKTFQPSTIGSNRQAQCPIAIASQRRLRLSSPH